MAVMTVDFAALVDALPDTVLVVDTDVTLMYVNPAGHELFGYEPSDWLGRSLLDLVHPDDVAAVVSSVGTMQQKTAGTPIELRVRTLRNEWKWVEILATNALADGELNGLVVVVRDLTRRRMWEVTKDDSVRFQHVVQHASSITLLLDADGKVAGTNAAFTRLLGHDPSNVVGRPLVDFCVSDDVGRLQLAIERAGTAARPMGCEVSMRLAEPGGEPRPIRGLLRVGEESLGVLVGRLPATRSWEPADQDLLDLYSSEVAVAVRNAQLFARVEAQNARLVALDAAKDLEKEGIDLEVVDLRSLLPFDKETVLESVKKTNKVILLHEDTRIGGFAGELAAVIADEAFEYLDGPIRRITAPDTPVPYSPPLEEFFLPKVSDIIRVARELYAY